MTSSVLSDGPKIAFKIPIPTGWSRRAQLDTFMGYLVKEGFLPEAPRLDDLFVDVGEGVRV